MSISDQIRAKWFATGRQAKKVVLSHGDLCQLHMETPIYRPPENPGREMIFGMGIALVLPREDCRNCGAPAEADKCSYCGTPATFVEVQ